MCPTSTGNECVISYYENPEVGVLGAVSFINKIRARDAHLIFFKSQAET